MRLKDNRPDSRSRNGFTLVELSIVLGIIGIITAGIWHGWASVRSASRVNETAAGIFELVTHAMGLFPLEAYPQTAFTSQNVTITMTTAKLTPPDWINGNLGALKTPNGTSVMIALACWTPCPMITVRVIGPASAWMPGGMRGKECAQLIRRIINTGRSDQNLIRIGVTGSTSSTYDSTTDPNTVTCPDDYTQVDVVFQPPTP